MPSSHSQFMFFWATYLTLFILYRLHNEVVKKSKFHLQPTLMCCAINKIENMIKDKIFAFKGQRWLPWWKIPLSLGCIGIASTVAYGRIYLHYHTVEQVLRLFKVCSKSRIFFQKLSYKIWVLKSGLQNKIYIFYNNFVENRLAGVPQWALGLHWFGLCLYK